MKPFAGLVALVVLGGAGAAQDHDPPEPGRVVLDNGLTVLLLPDRELPMVHGYVRIRGGTRHEPWSRRGVAWLAARLIRSGGTRACPADRLEGELDLLGAEVSTRVDVAFIDLLFYSLSRDFPAVFARVAEMLREPALATEKLELAKNDLRAELGRHRSDPHDLAEHAFFQIVHGPAYAHGRAPAWRTVEAVTRADVAAWHARHFHPDRVVLGLVGDFDPEGALALVRERLGDWKRGPAVEEPDDGPPLPLPPGVYTVEKRDVTQSTIMMGGLGMVRDEPDAAAVEVLNEVLGAQGARLFTSARSGTGLAYATQGGVYSCLDHRHFAFLLMITKVATTGAGIETLLREARDLAARPPGEDEVALAKAALLRSFAFRNDSKRELLAQRVDLELHGYPPDWFRRLREAIAGVSVEDVRAAARRWLRPEEFRILVVGPSEGRDRALEEFGPVTPLDRELGFPADPPRYTHDQLEAGFRLIHAAVAAMGGPEKIDAVRGLELVGSGVRRTSVGDVGFAGREILRFPALFLREETIGALTRRRLVLRDDAFEDCGRGYEPLPPARRVEAMLESRADPVLLLQTRLEDRFLAAALGPGDLAGSPLLLVAVERGDDRLLLGIDPRTGLVGGLSYAVPAGGLARTFSDWRSVEGLAYPFESTTTVGGRLVLRERLRQVSVDREPALDSATRPR